MKKHKFQPIYLLLLSAVLINTSCKKDFLEGIPPTSVSTAIFWTSDAEVQSAVTGVYSRLNENFLGYERVYNDGISDNAYLISGGNQGSIDQVATGGWTPNRGVLGNKYSTPYKLIGSANYFLANVDKAPIIAGDKRRYIAEVKFLRALAYFDLVQDFGDVVIYTTPPPTLDAAKIKQSPRADVYKLIEEDLDSAIAGLPDIRYNGHAVKGSAQALKGRVLLTQEKWADAATLLNTIITNRAGKFALSNEYAGLFTTAGQAKAAVNIEIMFSTQYFYPGKIHRTNSQGIDVELGLYAIMQPYADLVNEYEMTDGLSIGTSPNYDPTNPYANRDPRLNYTVKLPNEKWLYGAGVEFIPTGASNVATGFMTEKYVDLSRLPFNTTSGEKTDQDYIHLRFADVLLMFAEAQNESAGPSLAVYNALDSVRARPGVNMPPVNKTTYNTKEKLRDYIRHERRIELAMEGQRYNDLKRWKIADVKLPTLTDPGNRKLFFPAYQYTMPFPQSERDNNPQLDQKLGYDN